MSDEITDRRLDAEAFHALPEVDAREELVRGDVVREPLPAFGHGAVAVSIAWLLRSWVQRHAPARSPGRVVDHCGFVLARDPDTVRGPDVAFVSRERLAAGITGGPFFEGAPDLAVEVLSPSDRRRKMAAKAREYLRAGARRVWVVDPERETIAVHRPDGSTYTLGRNDVLEGGDVLPGFAVRAGKVFE